MSAKQTVEMVSELLKQGAQVFLTEDGWKAYVAIIAEAEQDVNDVQEVG
jgi:hypothetical protein